MSRKEKKGCFFTSCFGCIFSFFLIAVFLVLGVYLINLKSPNFKNNILDLIFIRKYDDNKKIDIKTLDNKIKDFFTGKELLLTDDEIAFLFEKEFLSKLKTKSIKDFSFHINDDKTLDLTLLIDGKELIKENAKIKNRLKRDFTASFIFKLIKTDKYYIKLDKAYMFSVPIFISFFEKFIKEIKKTGDFNATSISIEGVFPFLKGKIKEISLSKGQLIIKSK